MKGIKIELPVQELRSYSVNLCENIFTRAMLHRKLISSQGRYCLKSSRIRETKNLSTDADSRTGTNLKRLRDLSLTKKKIKKI